MLYWVSGYPAGTVITWFHFRLNILSHTNGSLWFFGMLQVVFNMESTFIMTLIKQENIVFISVILYIREYLCVFYKIVYGYLKISNFGYPVSRNYPKTHITSVFFLAIMVDQCHFSFCFLRRGETVPASVRPDLLHMVLCWSLLFVRNKLTSCTTSDTCQKCYQQWDSFSVS